MHGPAGFKNFDFHVLRKKNCPMTADGVRDHDINEQPCAVNPYKINTSYSIENRAFLICLDQWQGWILTNLLGRGSESNSLHSIWMSPIYGYISTILGESRLWFGAILAHVPQAPFNGISLSKILCWESGNGRLFRRAFLAVQLNTNAWMTKA